MSLHYILDGYNCIWSADNFGGGRLQDQRESFLRYLETVRPAGSDSNLVTVVFDGRDDVDSPRWKGTVRVLFSKGASADVLIKRLIDEMSNPANGIVVTDDREIQHWARASKVRVMSCKEFFELGRKRSVKNARRHRFMTSGDTGAGSQITDEFRQIWKEKN